MKAKLWEDLRPHRASVCPHMFVCLSSSRIWSTYGFWAGRVRLNFGHIHYSSLLETSDLLTNISNQIVL